jgi:hypothetical protein
MRLLGIPLESLTLVVGDDGSLDQFHARIVQPLVGLRLSFVSLTCKNRKMSTV